jgi:hypothetical protein
VTETLESLEVFLALKSCVSVLGKTLIIISLGCKFSISLLNVKTISPLLIQSSASTKDSIFNNSTSV